MTQLQQQTGHIPLPDPNSVSEPFWEGCRDGKLLFQRCLECGRPNFDPVAACRNCLSTRLEWEESHIAGAVHIPLHELPSRLDELPERPDELPGSPVEPPGRRADLPPGEVWVHCGAGYRSVVAASMLAARGRRVVAVDDDFANAEAAGQFPG